ncbi:MAG: AsmA family protein [Pseudomonadota bacterium]|nr:AsmA family protein [Pseudomonadota bacterium]
MQNWFRSHKKATAIAAIIGGLFLLIVVILALIDWNSLRPALARVITARTGRMASIDGDLKVHLFSWTPSAEVNAVTLKNPQWAEQQLMFAAKRITVNVSLGRLLRGQIVIPEISFIEPIVNLERDASGRASWELGNNAGTPNGNTQPLKIPTIRRLLVRDGKLQVVDEVRKLRFGGSLVALEESGKDDPSAFKIQARGTLNKKPFTLDANGGPLLALEPNKPYLLALRVSAADIKLDAQVSVLKPFDLGSLDVKFVLTGNDLADVFYLTGLALPNTPSYRFAASAQVSGTTYRLDDFQGRVGSSDLAGKIVVQTSGPRPQLTATLSSNTLNIVDLAPTLGKPPGGTAAQAPAKGRPKKTSPAAGANATSGLLLPDADLQVNRVRGMDANVTYTAGAVKSPKVPMKKVSFHIVLNNGLLTIDPLSFVLTEGRFAGNVQIDARKEIPETSIDMHIDDVDLSQYKTAKMTEAPLSGSLIGRFKLHGGGSSVHKFASSADGTVSVVIPHGEINSAIAELTGINVTRGLGLLLAKSDTKASIRCGVMDFQAQGGTLGAKTLFIDTTDVLITGKGDVHFNSEELDLALQGKPKKLRLTRIRSPITIKGTLSHPAVGVDPGKLAEQGAVAAALGTLLAPVAAVIAFVDPGRAKNKDCVQSISDATEPLRH